MNNECPLCGTIVAGDECNCDEEEEGYYLLVFHQGIHAGMLEGKWGYNAIINVSKEKAIETLYESWKGLDAYNLRDFASRWRLFLLPRAHVPLVVEAQLKAGGATFKQKDLGPLPLSILQQLEGWER